MTVDRATASQTGSDVRHAPSLAALTLSTFRNYPSLRLDLSPEPVVLFGDNGSGKTNLLEALSFLSPGRGLRRAPFDSIAQTGAHGDWAVSARLRSGSDMVSIGTGWQATAGSADRKRVTRIDGETAASAEALTDYARVLWLTPAMDGLFTGPAGDRRRYLDRLVLAVDPGHGRRVAGFERAMRGRNKLLEDERADPAWLSAQESQMAELGTAIAAARRDLVSRFVHLMTEIGSPDSGPRGETFPAAQLALEGSLEAALSDRSATDVEDMYQDMLAQGRRRDRAAGRTLDGPHRSDLHVRHAVKDMPAGLCSTGEQKALLLGLTLAHARLVSDFVDQAPLLLLDEVAAHLDHARRAGLVDELERIGGQCWLTGTDRALFTALENRAQFFEVNNAIVKLA
ncbi:MAG: DNA replication/repair protein RecF [Pseudomonadota bacterium]